MRGTRPACISAVAVATSLLAWSPVARASPIAYEAFAIPLASPFDGGAGFAGPWTSLPGFHGYSWNDSTLSVNGLRVGNGSVSGEASAIRLGFATRALGELVTSYPVVYVSFLVQPRGTLHEGSFDGFFGMVLSGTLGNVFAGKPGAGALDQYVLENVGGGGQAASGSSAVAERTALLVVKVQLSGGNDVLTLYVDPPVKGPEPASGAVKNDVDLGSLSALGIYSGGAFAIDEIRVGSTYADVVPGK
jgi:hypothetical protein